MIIAKVWLAKASGAKLITVPKGEDIDVGDYVMITKLSDTDDLVLALQTLNKKKEVSVVIGN
jgi:hypothetical protein